jgi:hypothetical protein
MATVYSLKVVFLDETGEGNVSMLYSYVNPSVTDTQVNALMDSMIAKKTIFANPPASKLSAKLISRTESDFTMS